MASDEDLFDSSVLELITPPPSLEFPAGYIADEAADWISRAASADRKTAFFDENLDLFLTIRFPVDGSDENPSLSPPTHLLSFLARLQISYDTSYISASPSDSDSIALPRLSVPPPRNSSIKHNKPGHLLATNPAIFPPHTPHPTPSAAESDLQYVQSQGTPLASAVWGESDNSDNDAFSLLWDSNQRSWLAVYKMSILVLFIATKHPDPLLCITVSATLRNMPLPITLPRKALVALIESAGGLQSILDRALSPTKSNGVIDEHPSDSEDEDLLSGLQEVNLLEGLATGSTFSDAQNRLSLPSTRLGTNTRMHTFSLGPVPASSAASTSVSYSSGVTSPPVSGNLPRSATLRKSFRKTLKTHMGFRVRMRTVFVPYFLLPQHPANGKTRKSRRKSLNLGSDWDDGTLEEREQLEAGNEEHTVVLSVEVENLFAGPSSNSPMHYHFEIERVDVAISGTGARAAFIGWGEDGSNIFPLKIAPREQVNLLYAVSFLRGPEVDEFSLAKPSRLSKNGPIEELHRAVSINLTVRPFGLTDDRIVYPTHAFPSRWNCVLDLASSSISQQKHGSTQIDDEDQNHDYFVLPTPASPFPTAPLAPPTRNLTPLTTNRSSLVPLSLSAVAGNKRHTFSAFELPHNDFARIPKSPLNYRNSTLMLNPAIPPTGPPSSSPTPTGSASGQTVQLPNSKRASYMPPSLAFQSGFPPTYSSPTAASLPLLPPKPPGGYIHVQSDSVSTVNEVLEPATPRTPAYPAYPTSPGPVPSTPFWQTPIAQQSGAGTVGPSIDIRRERGGAVPQTPGPTVGGFGGFGGFGRLGGAPWPGAQTQTQAGGVVQPVVGEAGMDAGWIGGGEPVVVSVGLLPGVSSSSSATRRVGKDPRAGQLYPLDQFTLDIFVFNRSSWTRRFEIGYPEERRRRRRAKEREEGAGAGGNAEVQPPGIIPLENRVRVGPLLPSTCQTVRMDFLALAPGVHSIEALTLTDVQSNFTMHLRNVIDIIVHEPQL